MNIEIKQQDLLNLLFDQYAGDVDFVLDVIANCTTSYSQELLLLAKGLKRLSDMEKVTLEDFVNCYNDIADAE